jgi:hypothetical protein
MLLSTDFYFRGRISTIDLQILTSSGLTAFNFKIYSTLLTKEAILTRRPTVQSLSLVLG